MNTSNFSNKILCVIYALDTIGTVLLTTGIVLLFFADLGVMGIDFNEVESYE